MSTLGSSNISWDAIGDVFQNFGNASNNNGRSGSWTVGNNTDLKERAPRQNGGTKANTTTNTFQADDFKGGFRVVPGHATYSTGSTKSQQNNAIFGWGTAGGVQAATNGSLTTAQGSLWDGTNVYTTQAKPLSGLGSQFDGNKWLSFIGYHSVGFTFTGILVFEGTGAQSNDTDWTSISYAVDASSGLGTGGSAGTTLTRASNFTVSTGFNRVIYETPAILGGNSFSGSNTWYCLR
jgi:hypothetical protein